MLLEEIHQASEVNIRKQGRGTMNRDEGDYRLSPIWTQNQGGRLQSDFVRLSRWLTPSEAFLRLLTLLMFSKFW